MYIDEKDIGLAIAKSVANNNKPARIMVNGLSLCYNGVKAYKYTIIQRELDSIKSHLEYVQCQRDYEVIGCSDTVCLCISQSKAARLSIMKYTALAVADLTSLTLDLSSINSKKIY